MSWVYASCHCLPGRVVACSAGSCWDGAQSAPWSLIQRLKICSARASVTDCLTTSRSGVTPTPLTVCRGEGAWIYSPPGSLANRSPWPVSARHLKIIETDGQQPLAYWERSGQGGHCWKMSQASLPLNLDDTLSASSMKWPRWAMTRDGVCLELRMLERLTNGIGGGVYLPTPSASTFSKNKSLSPGSKDRLSLHAMAQTNQWPTPTVSGNHNRKGASKTSGDGLATVVAALEMKRWPTPTANDAKNASCPASPATRDSIPGEMIRRSEAGPLNPGWVEWLMGWPTGWTDLKPLETDKFQAWRLLHGSCLAALIERLEDARDAYIRSR